MTSLTDDRTFKNLVHFALPYLASSFMQTFYGIADLYVTGLFNSKDAVPVCAVTLGSQVMHMITVIILGLAMGTTVKIGNEVGRKDSSAVHKTILSTAALFSVIAVVFTAALLLLTNQVVFAINTPSAARGQTSDYLRICFSGIPFIIAYNVISSIFRGMGDTKHPMIFVAVACILNIALDFLFIGYFDLHALGAAFGTILSQAFSVAISLAYVLLKKRKTEKVLQNSEKSEIPFRSTKKEKPSLADCKWILKIGFPIALQDAFVQISFLTITYIANSRGLIASASVGIVEKIIGFLFLVPSAFLASVSAITAQNYGAQKLSNAKKTLRLALIITCSWGALCALYCQFWPESIVSLFTGKSEVIFNGGRYLKSYSYDVLFAAIHFCFSGYFCGICRSKLSFIQNIISIFTVRIPGAALASWLFPSDLFPMGLAAPLGSLLSGIICIIFFIRIEKKSKVIKNES